MYIYICVYVRIYPECFLQIPEFSAVKTWWSALYKIHFFPIKSKDALCTRAHYTSFNTLITLNRLYKKTFKIYLLFFTYNVFKSKSKNEMFRKSPYISTQYIFQKFSISTCRICRISNLFFEDVFYTFVSCTP